ncbi:MAG: SDR family oxidoreductase [Candidatus Beckwithbacteria bacterium]
MEKLAVVTGASSGLGQAVSSALKKAGYRLILTSRSKSSNLNIIPADLSNFDSINSLIKKIKSSTKQVDVLVNLAGIWHGTNEVYANKDLEKFPQKIILDTFMVGTIAPALLIHGLLPLMPKKAKIINISGTFKSGAKGWLPYYVSKRAIEDLTVGLSQELERLNIQVNAVSPSDCATLAYKKFFPQYLNEAIDPKIVAKFLVDLCQKDITGKVFVLKKDKQPFTSFHY